MGGGKKMDPRLLPKSVEQIEQEEEKSNRFYKRPSEKRKTAMSVIATDPFIFSGLIGVVGFFGVGITNMGTKYSNYCMWGRVASQTFLVFALLRAGGFWEFITSKGPQYNKEEDELKLARFKGQYNKKTPIELEDD